MRQRGSPTTGDRCPRCRGTGPIVGVVSVRPHRPDAVYGGWQYCTTEGCRVVFYLGSDAVDEDEVVARVGDKAGSKPEPVCFCFASTTFDLAVDLEMNDGVGTISSAIRRAAASGLCACDHLNPTHTCCLPEIGHRIATIKQLTTL